MAGFLKKVDGFTRTCKTLLEFLCAAGGLGESEKSASFAQGIPQFVADCQTLLVELLRFIEMSLIQIDLGQDSQRCGDARLHLVLLGHGTGFPDKLDRPAPIAHGLVGLADVVEDKSHVPGAVIRREGACLFVKLKGALREALFAIDFAHAVKRRDDSLTVFHLFRQIEGAIQIYQRAREITLILIDVAFSLVSAHDPAVIRVLVEIG